MKLLFTTCALVGAQLLTASAFAQGTSADQAATRAERKAEGVAAAHSFMPGEGDPIPEPRMKATQAERVAARQARRLDGAEATHDFMPGEGDPMPAPTAQVSREERLAGREAIRAEVRRANKAGELPSYNDNYGGR